MGEKKYFVLMKNGKDTAQVFHSRQPRGAALKAASRGETDIHLRERNKQSSRFLWREKEGTKGTKRARLATGHDQQS